MNSSVKVLGFAYRNWIFATRSLFSFVEIVFWPLVSLITIALMAEFIGFKGSLRNFIFTGVITSGVLQIAQLDVSYGTLYDVWSKSSKHTFLAPVSHLNYLVGSWLIGILRGFLVFVLLLAMAYVYFGFRMPPFWPVSIFLAGIYLQALVIGTLVCTLIILFGQKVEITAWSLVALLMLLCGIYYPVNYLPGWLQIVAQMIPLTYFLEYIRVFYGFEPLFSFSLIKGFVLVVLYQVLALFLISKAFDHSSRTGKVSNLSE